LRPGLDWQDYPPAAALTSGGLRLAYTPDTGGHRGIALSQGEGERERERERERDKENYICSSHLGLIRWRIGTLEEIETGCDEPRKSGGRGEREGTLNP
jgi:hypothetical protein